MKNLKFKPALLLGAAAMFVVAVTSSLAQELPEKLPTKEDLAKNNKLFAELATNYLHWDESTDPIHFVGPPPPRNGKPRQGFAKPAGYPNFTSEAM